jgi:hypothetical protein
VREIVKRETIETSIAVGRSAACWCQACATCIRLAASQHQFGWLEKGKRKMGSALGSTFYRRLPTQAPGLRHAVAVIIGQDRSPDSRTTRRPRVQGAEVDRCMRFQDADEMVLNDPS